MTVLWSDPAAVLHTEGCHTHDDRPTKRVFEHINCDVICTLRGPHMAMQKIST